MFDNMHPIDHSDIMNLAQSPSFEDARALLRQRRIWKFIDRRDEPAEHIEHNQKIMVPPGYAGAYVLGEEPEPCKVLWNEEEWICECGSVLPCIHLEVLLLLLADGQNDDLQFPSGKTRKKSCINFDTDLSRSLVPDPELDLLFFPEAEKVEKKSVLVLGTKTSVDATLNHQIAIHPGRSDHTALEFSGIKGDLWCLRKACILPGNDTTPDSVRPWNSDLPPAPPFNPDSGIGRELTRLLNNREPLFTPAGKTWSVEKAESVRIRFEPLLSALDDEPCYEAIVELTSGKKIFSGGLVSAENSLLVLDEELAVSAVLNNTGSYIWFIRLILSRNVLSVSDIHSRLTGKHHVPGNIEILIPDLPESLSVLKPTLVLEISTRAGSTDFLPRWRYGDIVISSGQKGDIVIDKQSCFKGLRDRNAEETLLLQAEALLLADLSWQRGCYSSLSGNDEIPLRLGMSLTDVLARYAALLIDTGVEIRLEDRPVLKGGTLEIQARQNTDILELKTLVVSKSSTLSLHLDEWFDNGGLAGTRDAYFTLTDKALKQLDYLRSHGMENSGFLSASPDNLSLIDTVYSEIEADEDTVLNLERKRSIYKRLSERNPEKCPLPPKDFNAVLRPYQMYGYAWLLYMRENKLGGCLADDMGLGKTVQTLAYLSRLKADGKLAASLMVGPVVTLANWEVEIKRFAPQLKFHRYSGPAEKRYLPETEEIDLIVVSYQTLRNDIEKFLDREWDHIILDEAHYVKNSSSRTFKAVRSIKASHRLSLTGTPLENHLNELWSQMSFLNPGLLGSRNEFIQRYVKPMEQHGERRVPGRLSDIVSPFILRRKKEEVLHDLPSRDETVLFCEMTTDQAEAYHSVRELYFRQVSGLLSNEGLPKARIQIFTILSKLRLLAIHPPLAGEQFRTVSSGKMAVLDNLMEEIFEEDHKILIFSQFIGALDRARETCQRNNWRFSRLTGSTRNREEEIHQFQTDSDTRVFLLSLRAGGVGINLTAADYVVLLDPWWNPAVEAQAVGRAHRMGQTRSVMTYRLITAGTIEEKVLELQESKKNMIASVLREEGNPMFDENEILKMLE